MIIKSGDDFKSLSLITVEERPLSAEEHNRIPKEPITDDNVVADQIYSYGIIQNRYSVNIKRLNITRKLKPNEEIQKIVDDYYGKLEEQMKVINSQFNSEMDVNHGSLRTMETKIGNFLTDIMKKHNESDIAIINGGAIRAGKTYPKGKITIGDWYDILPFENPILKMEVKGDIIHKVLENGVSQYPKLDGRFPQVSGIKFTFDASKKAGNRIKLENIFINGKPLNYEETYTVACNSFISEGKEGYSAMTEGVELIDEESAPLLKQILDDFFGNF